jgi:C-terminal processing protease CtpA/Prc
MKEYPAKNAMGATTKVKLVGSTFSAVAILNLPATYGSIMLSKDIKMPADVARNVIKRAQWHLKIRTLLAPGQKSLVVEDGTYIKPTITDPVEVYVDGRTITAVLTHADLIDPDRSDVIASFDLPPVDINDPFVSERKGSNDVLGVGLEVTPPDIQHALGLNVTTGSGCILTSVMQGSPAERAGLQLGDVVTRIQDTQINHVPDVSSALLNISPGTERLFVVHRQGQLMVLRIKF